MNVFRHYSRYYDLLYKDKDYRAEADYVHGLIQRWHPKAEEILEFGCGTGMHALELASKGYTIHGVDQSSSMLQRAEVRMKLAGDSVSSRLKFSCGDIRHVEVESSFDAVLALFHVVSYQATNEDLIAVFRNAARHVNPGGIFLFDFWYGPAVLTDRPSVRIKRLEDETIKVTRIAEPVMHPRRNLVDVNYTLIVSETESEKVEECQERHQMRYLFEPEIELLCRLSGLELVETSTWMSDEAPGFNTWLAHAVARKSAAKPS